MTDIAITELVDGDVDELHMVGTGANGFPPLLAKAIKDAVHSEIASGDFVDKAVVSTADQNDLPDSDFAYIEPGGKKDSEGKTTPRSLRHFPIMDAAHVRNALARAPQSPFGDKAMPAIEAAAKKFGVEVSKADGGDDDMKDCDTCKGKGTIMDGHRKCPDCGGDGKMAKAVVPIMADGPGDGVVTAVTPGSPSWEAQDAAMLQDSAAALTKVATALAASQSREAMEVAVGQADDIADVMDLGAAIDMIKNSLGIVARLSFQEAAEGNLAKAGAKHSGATLDKLRSFRDGLTDMIGDGKAADDAPEDDDKSDDDVEKTEAPADGGADEEEDVMASLTKEDLAQVVGEAVGSGMAKALEAFVAAQAGNKPADTQEVTKAEDTTPAPESDPVVVAGADPMERLAEAIAKGLAPVVEGQQDMASRLAALENSPRPGLLHSGAGARAQLRGQGTASTPEEAVEQYRDALLKAKDRNDVGEIERLTMAISVASLKQKYLAAGMDNTPPR